MPEELHTGWSRDLDIPTALEMIPPDELQGRVALISMIDSTSNVSELPSLVPLIENLGRSYSKVNGDVAVEIQTLMTLINDQDFFTGFDEVWLCSATPASGKPAGLRITSDTPLESRPPPGLADWMIQSSCRLGLGDGDGLNFATFDPDLAALLHRQA